MYLPNEFIIALSLFGFSGFLISIFCFWKIKSFKIQTEETILQMENLEFVLENQQTEFEKSIARVKDQAQNIAQKNFGNKVFENEKSFTKSEEFVPEKSELSERKVEILSMARRGENTRTIAEKLGLMTGEVELIVNLNRQVPGFF